MRAATARMLLLVATTYTAAPAQLVAGAGCNLTAGGNSVWGEGGGYKAYRHKSGVAMLHHTDAWFAALPKGFFQNSNSDGTPIPNRDRLPAGLHRGAWAMGIICAGLFSLLEKNPDAVCGRTIHTPTKRGHKPYAKWAVLDCGGTPSAPETSPHFVVLQVCSTGCMKDPTKRCCAVPKSFAALFPCCREECCCPDNADDKACVPQSKKIDDSCKGGHAKNGICDSMPTTDPAYGKGTDSMCPLGSDCTDCGTCLGQTPGNTCKNANNGRCDDQIFAFSRGAFCGGPVGALLTDCTDCAKKYPSLGLRCSGSSGVSTGSTTSSPTSSSTSVAGGTGGTGGSTQGTVQCSDQQAGDYCDCGGDCGGDFCKCTDALACCQGKGGHVTGGQNGEDACENHGYSEAECKAVGCCQYDPNDAQTHCMSAVGNGLCIKKGKRRHRRAQLPWLRHAQGVSVSVTVEDNTGSRSAYDRLMFCLTKHPAEKCNTTSLLSGH